jgi:hypothetical protein
LQVVQTMISTGMVRPNPWYPKRSTLAACEPCSKPAWGGASGGLLYFRLRGIGFMVRAD